MEKQLNKNHNANNMLCKINENWLIKQKGVKLIV